ncbi:MAG: hypothetical protein JJ975_14950 [Bacteroidia bacterium]|nr:hypothetical protein [Bacteroidia bacterium]
MSKIDKKLEQIKLQHDITEILREDNGVSCHFDYHVNLVSDSETIKLNVLTYNQRHNEYMLLHTVKGTSSLDCLSKVKSFLVSQSHDSEEYSYSVKWKKKDEETEHVSYFVGSSREEVEIKFLHEKNIDDYSYEIYQNPVA